MIIKVIILYNFSLNYYYSLVTALVVIRKLGRTVVLHSVQSLLSPLVRERQTDFNVYIVAQIK